MPSGLSSEASWHQGPLLQSPARALVPLQPKVLIAFQHVALRHPRPQAAPPRPAIVDHRGDYHQHEEAAEEGQDDHGSPSLPSLYVLAIVSRGVRPCTGQLSRHAAATATAARAAAGTTPTGSCHARKVPHRATIRTRPYSGRPASPTATPVSPTVTPAEKELAGSGSLAKVLAAALRAGAKAFSARRSRTAAGGCTHEEASPDYRVPDSMRALVEARDQTCGFPTCRQPAWRCEQDHTIAHRLGGPTCPCNLSPDSIT